jgi:hypothetical protein
MSKIFVRNRRHAVRGTGRPRFAIVATEGTDLKVFKSRVRLSELEKIAADIGAEIVYLPRGEHAEDSEEFGQPGDGRRHHRGRRRED